MHFTLSLYYLHYLYYLGELHYHARSFSNPPIFVYASYN